MVRTGFVKAKSGSSLQICFERPQACEGCRGCSKGLLPKKELLTAFGEAEIGDVVECCIEGIGTLRNTVTATKKIQ